MPYTRRNVKKTSGYGKPRKLFKVRLDSRQISEKSDEEVIRLTVNFLDLDKTLTSKTQADEFLQK